ncbi:MAG TPA: outer membrane protein assembly factor BamD [Candidatus Paceibacterota bacterium]|nr:outer membrane protein assembly factor BamD [Verrucomicrobiota bacterium]HSA11322.1 outer membrane protein assembly factor BamD [Candidatus Paceibacterota bacterium]
MAVLCRWILLLIVLLAAEPRLLAATPADRAFDAAVKAFHDTFYDRAEAELADFRQKHPASPRLAEAILLQAQARLQLSNYAGAIELLSAHQNAAGTNADQYLFWIAEARARNGEWRTAGVDFAKVVKEYPNSARRLEAVIGEASARAALARMEPAEWPKVIELLQATNGTFQAAVRAQADAEQLAQGWLLLAEAQLATKAYRSAEAIIQPLAKRLLKPLLAWQWQYLLCRIQQADGRPEAALQGTTNLLAMAADTGQSNLQAESAAFQGGLFEGLGRTNEAIVAYQRNLAQGVPAERQRQALLKITRLYLAHDNIPGATEMLEKFLAQYPEAASADLALLTLGELRLRLHDAGGDSHLNAGATTNAPGSTNGLQLALASFRTLVKKFPKSPLWGKAQLDLGWCYWQEGKLPEAQAAFQAAVECLPFSNDLAAAYYRLADTQFRQADYAGAIKNYQAIIEKFAALPEARTNFFERALCQTVRAGLAANDLATATNALQRVRVWYPDSPDTARAVLLAGQEVSRQGGPAVARRMLLEFAQSAPHTPLLAEVQLALAATYEQEKKWAEAIAQYDGWLAGFTNHAARPRAEYYRAWANFQAGRETNALACFTNLVAQFPTSEFAPLAQWWVADYYFRAGPPAEAEMNYKLLFQNTNWPPSELTYEAQLMAGRAAVARQGWGDARYYFTNLYNNLNGPSLDLRLQALFEHGQALMRVVDPSETNKLANCEEATRAFGRICDDYPTNRLAVRAWAERANCYMQWALARQQYDSLTNALNAFQRVIDSPQADVPARSQAKVGQAIVLGKWAEQKGGEARVMLLKQALSNCVDVVYGNILKDEEVPDQFWTREAGIEAFNLAEAMQAWSQAAGIYRRLTNTVWPQLPASLEKRAFKALEHLEREKASL